MRSLLACVLIGLLCPLAAAEENCLSAEQIRDGWISLFDGKTLFGWQPTSDVDWQVADGEIRATEGKQGLLATTTQFADYELHVEFKATKNTNSGVFLRSPLQPKDPATDCYELNIAPRDNPYTTGSLVGRYKLPHGPRHARAKATRNPLENHPIDAWDGEWHHYDITLEQGRILIRLDGSVQQGYDDSQPILRGHIGLQFNEGEIAFRNIRLKPLGTKSIFNGKDLTGWNTDLAEKSRFEVTPEGELRVLDGKGQIESEGRYGDFVLQLECFVAGDSLNSGIFFRCIPGDMMMGYESQIHNGMKDGDPAQPADCGTGGIFRRQNARRIVASDHEWFSKTLIAEGPHIAVWVNGYQVSDWTDTRKPHENPRKGLRLEPGTLAIQGHDPTTDLRFRELQIVEMPKNEKEE